MSLELTDEERAFVRNGIKVNIFPWSTIILKLQAGKMKAEFCIEHDSCWIDTEGDWACEEGDDNKIDPRHSWTNEQWLEAAKKKLADTEESKG